MKKKAHSESEMVKAVNELESGVPADSVARGSGAVLDAYIFRNLEEARTITESRMTYYNTERPHVSLGNMTPLELLPCNRDF